MKNTVKLFEIIVLVAVIVFSMAGCVEDKDENDSSTAGRLTVTGLSSYDGFKIYADRVGQSTSGEGLTVKAPNTNPNDTHDVIITGGLATFHAWNAVIHGSGKNATYSYKSYTGNDQNVKFNIMINNPGVSSVQGSVTVDFTNGIGQGSFVPNPDQ